MVLELFGPRIPSFILLKINEDPQRDFAYVAYIAISIYHARNQHRETY